MKTVYRRRLRRGVIPLPFIAAMFDIWFLTLVMSVASSNPVVTGPALTRILDAVLEDRVTLIELNRPLTGFDLPCILHVQFPSGKTRRDLLENRSTDLVILRSFPSACPGSGGGPFELVGDFESEVLNLERVVWISSSEVGVWYQSRSPFRGVRTGVLRLAIDGNRWKVVERRNGNLSSWRQVFHERPIL